MSEENAPEAQKEESSTPSAAETQEESTTPPAAETQEESTTPPVAETKEEDSTMPSAGKQIKVMALIVVGITVVLGGGVWLSTLLR